MTTPLTLKEKLALIKQQQAANAPATPTPTTSAAPAIAPSAAVATLLASKLVSVPKESAIEPSEIEIAADNVLLAVHEDMKTIEGFNPDVFVTLLPKLASEIEAKAPGVGRYLEEINKNLTKYQELTHLLNDDQLSVITSGLFYLTDTTMLVAATKKGSKAVLTQEQIAGFF